MKKLLLFLCAIGLAFGVAGNAWATLLDLSTTSSGTVNGAIFETWDANPAGRGVYGTFLAIQGDGITQGYNTDARPVEFDETNAAPHNHSLLLSAVGQVNIGGVWYYEFGLDADQAPGTGSIISLDELQIFQNNNPMAYGYPAGLGTLVWDLDGAGESTVLVDYLASSGGSGWTDMIVDIPSSLFDTNYSNVVLYSQFSLDNDGPQEWRHRVGGAPVPEPATMLLLGSGLIGLGVFGRKKLFKKS